MAFSVQSTQKRILPLSGEEKTTMESRLYTPSPLAAGLLTIMLLGSFVPICT